VNISPDITQATWELGSAVFSVLSIRAVRRSRSIRGVHWAPTAYFFGWGLYNLWFYQALHLPLAWWGGMAITVTNLVWLGHVGWYASQRRRDQFMANRWAKRWLAELRADGEWPR
jgi:hypothetical protein